MSNIDDKDINSLNEELGLDLMFDEEDDDNSGATTISISLDSVNITEKEIALIDKRLFDIILDDEQGHVLKVIKYLSDTSNLKTETAIENFGNTGFQMINSPDTIDGKLANKFYVSLSREFKLNELSRCGGDPLRIREEILVNLLALIINSFLKSTKHCNNPRYKIMMDFDLPKFKMNTQSTRKDYLKAKDILDGKFSRTIARQFLNKTFSPNMTSFRTQFEGFIGEIHKGDILSITLRQLQKLVSSLSGTKLAKEAICFRKLDAILKVQSNDELGIVHILTSSGLALKYLWETGKPLINPLYNLEGFSRDQKYVAVLPSKNDTDIKLLGSDLIKDTTKYVLDSYLKSVQYIHESVLGFGDNSRRCSATGYSPLREPSLAYCSDLNFLPLIVLSKDVIIPFLRDNNLILNMLRDGMVVTPIHVNKKEDKSGIISIVKRKDYNAELTAPLQAKFNISPRLLNVTDFIKLARFNEALTSINDTRYLALTGFRRASMSGDTCLMLSRTKNICKMLNFKYVKCRPAFYLKMLFNLLYKDMYAMETNMRYKFKKEDRVFRESMYPELDFQNDREKLTELANKIKEEMGDELYLREEEIIKPTDKPIRAVIGEYKLKGLQMAFEGLGNKSKSTSLINELASDKTMKVSYSEEDGDIIEQIEKSIDETVLKYLGVKTYSDILDKDKYISKVKNTMIYNYHAYTTMMKALIDCYYKPESTEFEIIADQYYTGDIDCFGQMTIDDFADMIALERELILY